VEERQYAHINTVELGQHGRSRSNVWDYAGVNTPKFGRLEELAMHPTVKPITLVSNAIKDYSRRNGLVLDPFVGSGTVLIETERIGRKAHALGTDQSYVEVAIKRCRHSVERENHRMASQRASSWN
jgi:DNA modification methylase